MKALPVLDTKAAAIDVGSEQLHVSIGGDAPRVFGTFTGDLEALRDWFKEQAVRAVAMEVILNPPSSILASLRPPHVTCLPRHSR